MKRWKDYLAKFIAIVIIIIVIAVTTVIILFLNCIPAIVLGHILKG